MRHPPAAVKRIGGIEGIERMQHRHRLRRGRHRLIIHARPGDPEQRALPPLTDGGMIRLHQGAFRLNAHGQIFFSTSPTRL